MTSIADRVRITKIEQHLDDLERAVADQAAAIAALTKAGATTPNAAGASESPASGRAAILAALVDASQPLTPGALAKRLDKSPPAVKMMLGRMLKASEVVTEGRGRYAVRPAV